MIKLFWYSKTHLKRGHVLNFGDELSRDIVQELSGKRVKWVNPLEQNLIQKNFSNHVLGLGSILHFGAKNSLVWGSGLIDSKSSAPDAKYFAVRGKYTRNELLKRGCKVPQVYGDPGLLTSKLFPNLISVKQYKIGVIPHYVEFDEVNLWYLSNNTSNEILMIDLRDNIKTVLGKILSCEYIISSSLHGIIIPQSYNIPTLRAVFTNRIIGDGIKYEDYFDSVGIDSYKPLVFSNKNFTDVNLNKFTDKFDSYGRINNSLLKLQNSLNAVKPF